MRLGKRAPTGLLSGVPLFADSSDEELAEIAALAEEVSVPEGNELTHEGHRGGLFVVMLQGTADVLVGDQRVRTLGPGDFLGEIAMVVGGRSSATVMATSLVRALILSESDFRQVLARSPSLRAKVERQAFDRLRNPMNVEPESS
jgi:CRP-like cAMP-binding protein